jgi:CheY-like chemotaxis protein
LIVDDEPAVSASLRRALGREHDVTLASSSEQALQILSEELFDVILCDVYMPHLTGLDLYDTITSQKPELADTFLFMSGGVDSATRTRLTATTREVIDKPFAINDLRALLKKKTNAKQD